MEFQLSKTDLSEMMRRYVARRLHFALGRFGSRVGLLSVRIAGYDGSPGARHLCQISAQMAPFGEVSVQESHPDLHLAIDRACGKIARSFARELERMRDLRTTRETIRAA
ncbi:MAG TPA: HPF/RaiA family ribosome-associated protein [Terriglobales bacterium]|nr:HPF/RaiA family ribosome-associated protein [Terriglobales bacterium]